jgi:hypothetical protein
MCCVFSFMTCRFSSTVLIKLIILSSCHIGLQIFSAATLCYFSSSERADVSWYCNPSTSASRLHSNRFPTVAVRGPSHIWSCGISVERSGTRAGFLRVLHFPLPILIPSTASYSSVIRDWCSGPNSGLHPKLFQSPPHTDTKLTNCGSDIYYKGVG